MNLQVIGSAGLRDPLYDVKYSSLTSIRICAGCRILAQLLFLIFQSKLDFKFLVMMDENAGKCDLDGSLVESTPESVQYWPYLSFEYFPKRQYHIHHEFKNPSGKQKTVENNFFKGLKW